MFTALHTPAIYLLPLPFTVTTVVSVPVIIETELPTNAPTEIPSVPTTDVPVIIETELPTNAPTGIPSVPTTDVPVIIETEWPEPTTEYQERTTDINGEKLFLDPTLAIT